MVVGGVVLIIILLIQRYLAYTVDGVVLVIKYGGYSVGGTFHHHAAAPHTAKVGALYGVHDAAGIDRHHTVSYPIGWVGHPGGSLLPQHSSATCWMSLWIQTLAVAIHPHGIAILFQEQCQQLVFGHVGARSIGCAFAVFTWYYALEFLFIVGLFAWRQRVIGSEGNLLFFVVFYVVVVGTVVGDVQFSVAVNERHVAVAIKAAGMSCTDSNEVTVVNVIDGGCGVAVDGGGVDT